MQNAVIFTARVWVGPVPDADDLAELDKLGFRVLIDLRDGSERPRGFVRAASQMMGMQYIGVPITREQITIENVLTFYEAVYQTTGMNPVYCFSRFGKRPLALLLLFEAVNKNKPLAYVYKRAATFGFNLEGDLLLDAFLVEFFNNGMARRRVTRIVAQPAGTDVGRAFPG